jgi:hypothetical protein
MDQYRIKLFSSVAFRIDVVDLLEDCVNLAMMTTSYLLYK